MQLSGSYLDIFVALASGVLVSFSPCIYPVLPMTAAFLAGANPQGSKKRGFLISNIYVLGMATTYGFLAVLAALTGKIFGRIQNHPAVLFLTALFFIFFALALLGIVKIPYLNLSGKSNKYLSEIFKRHCRI